MTKLTPLTQKAQGIVALKDGCHSLGLKDPGFPLMVIPGALDDCYTSNVIFPMFARPCPFRPRHGFVDSVKVNNWRQVIEILQKAKEADPSHAVEVVLVPVLTGKVSAVATNAGVTWGRGNDGVTSGTDSHALFIPVKTSRNAWQGVVGGMVDDLANLEIPEFPYLEIVENKGDMHLVQVRDGPEQPEGVNHVIRKMKVKRVLKADYGTDLLTWEGLVRQAAKEKGTVIYAPCMSLASHFCVHGIESGVPVITDHKVKVGDVIQPTKNRTSTLRKREYARVAALITKTLDSDLKLPNLGDQKDAILTAIATTQAQFCWGKEPHLLRLRGLSIAVLLKAVLASCAGEIRHWPSQDGPGHSAPSLFALFEDLSDLQYRRNDIYKNVFRGAFTFVKMNRALRAAKADLANSGWKRGFGGRCWAEVANTGIELSKTAERFCALPCAAAWAKVVQSANRLINTSHNNGKCLTKWVDEHAMMMISESPTAGFLNPYVARVALNMTDEGEKT